MEERERPVAAPQENVQGQAPKQGPQPYPVTKPFTKKKHNPNEERILKTIHSGRFLALKWYILGIILLGLGIITIFKLVPEDFLFILNYMDPYAEYLYILIGLGVIFLLMAELKTRSDKYVFTTHRIKHLKGHIGMDETSFEYDSISHYSVTQTIFESLLGHGTISIERVAGGRTAQTQLRHIPHVKKVKRMIDKLVTMHGGYGRKK